jgi:catechol 2,3-dioxygenase-like lactoylglutathione lyase family enzyme
MTGPARAPHRARTQPGPRHQRPEGGFAPLVPELDVTSLPASIAFWCGPLGFTVAYDRPAAGFAYLQRDGAQVMLCERNGNWDTGPLERPFGRGANFQIAVASIAPILAALAAAGWPLFRPVQERWYRTGNVLGGSRELLVQVPDGYLLRFAESLGARPAP